jgi:hypothetical protein
MRGVSLLMKCFFLKGECLRECKSRWPVYVARNSAPDENISQRREQARWVYNSVVFEVKKGTPGRNVPPFPPCIHAPRL